jgi:hypothetical protein
MDYDCILIFSDFRAGFVTFAMDGVMRNERRI